MQNTQAVDSHLHTGHVNTSESEDLHLPYHKPRDVVVLHLHIDQCQHSELEGVCHHKPWDVVVLHLYIDHVNTVN